MEQANFESGALLERQSPIRNPQASITKAGYGEPVYVSDLPYGETAETPLVVIEKPKIPKRKLIAAVGFAVVSGLIAGHEGSDPLKAEEAPAPAPVQAPAQPKPWKYQYSKPSHGPLSPKLQRQLNSITPSMYRQFINIGNNCEGRRNKWRKDNGRFGGGLNITDTNWASRQYGGKDFARKAELATPAEQMVVMMRIQASFGWGVPNWCPLAQWGPWKPQYKVFKNR